MAMGMGFGSLAGVALGIPTRLAVPWGLCIGMMVGMVVGLLLDARPRAPGGPGGGR